jgi:tetratricopeptide (TPR) repeat protein
MRMLSGSTTFSRFTAAVVAGALAATSIAPLAHAQAAPAAGAAATEPDKKTRDAARKAYAEGQEAYEKGDFPAAHDGFKRAYDLIPSAHAQYWMAMSLDKQYKVNEALAAFEVFLANPDAAKVGEEKLAAAKARHEELRATTIAQINLTTTPAGATITVDGEEQAGQTPMRLELDPGEHKLVVAAEGHQPKELDLTVEAGQKLEETIELIPEPAPEAEQPAAPPPEPEPTPPPPPPEEKSMVPAYVTLGIAGAGAVVGTIFGIMALGKKSDYDDAPTADKADAVERNALIADMAFGVAITLGVTGVVLLTSSETEEGADSAARPLPKRATLNVAPYVTPTGGGAAARLTF